MDGQLAAKGMASSGNGELRRAAASVCACGVAHLAWAMRRRRTAVRLRTGGGDGVDGDVVAEGVGGAAAEATEAE